MLLRLCAETPHGCSVKSLQDKLAIKRAQLYRDFTSLESVGYLFNKETRGGETFYSINELNLPAPSAVADLRPKERLSLLIARESMQGLARTNIIQHFDSALVKLLGLDSAALSALSGPNPYRVSRPYTSDELECIDLIEEAIQNKQDIDLLYQSAHEESARPRCVQPIAIVIHQNAAYLSAIKVQPSSAMNDDTPQHRFYKLSRITDVTILDTKFTFSEEAARALSDEAMPKQTSFYSGDEIRVEIEFPASYERYVEEFPIALNQQVLPIDEETLCIQAKVHGVDVAMRWVLSWGDVATVRSPDGLRARLRELTCVLSHRYQ